MIISGDIDESSYINDDDDDFRGDDNDDDDDDDDIGGDDPSSEANDDVGNDLHGGDDTYNECLLIIRDKGKALTKHLKIKLDKKNIQTLSSHISLKY